MIFIEYEIEDAGWANGKISNGESEIEFDISYLHDSLKELAESAIDIPNKDYKMITFMAEPGEIQLVIQRSGGNEIEYEARWFSDWASWGMIDTENYKIVLKGETTVPKYINQVRKVLMKIMDELGPELYKIKWKNHNFPKTEYEQLK